MDLPPTRTGDPDTSYAAARAIAPWVSRIQGRILIYGKAAGLVGFTDDEMQRAIDPNRAKSSLRSRRKELTDANVIIATSRRRPMLDGDLPAVVYVFRDYADNPPPIKSPQEQKADRKRQADEFRALANTLDGMASQAGENAATTLRRAADRIRATATK